MYLFLNIGLNGNISMMYIYIQNYITLHQNQHYQQQFKSRLLPITGYQLPLMSIIIIQQQMQIKQRQTKSIYAIGTMDMHSEEGSKSLPNVSPVTKRNFKLYIGELNQHDVDEDLFLVPIQQQRRNTGHDKTSFILKKEARIKKQEILINFPFTCIITGNKMTIPEEQVRRILTEFKKMYQQDEPDKSDFSDGSFDRSEKAQESNRGRGRPKGSKNKRKDGNEEQSSDQQYENSDGKRDEKKPSKGRPKGSKNKKMELDDDFFIQLNFHSVFKKLFQNRSFEEINKKMNKQKMRVKEERVQEVYEEMPGKRARGRPKGRKNKIKADQDGDSQANMSIDLPDPSEMEKLPKGYCCSKCTQRQNKKLYLEGKLRDKSVLRNIAENIGVQDTTNLIIDAIKNGRPTVLKQLMGVIDVIQNDFLVPWDCNNRLEYTFYTIRTRKDYIRKQKQMINAMLQDRFVFKGKWWQIVGIQRIIENIPHYESGVQIYKTLVESEPLLKQIFFLNIPSFVKSGNYPLSNYLMTLICAEKQLNTNTYGYSKEHLQCLNKDRNELNFKKAAMLKQNCTANFCSPIHCAVINPNVQLLSYIIKHISEFNVGDSSGRKPIHYAATLQSPKAMELILKNGGDLKDIDKKKMTPLMIAAQLGRYKIIKFILEKVRQKQYINFKGEDDLSALHYATIYKHRECISLLLDDSLMNKYEETRQKFTILHLATGGGDKDIVKMILSSNVKSTFDNFRRSPLTISLRNHQNDIFFFLLKQIQVSFKKDYSNNTLLHYAAAYGNIDVVIYLTKVIDQIPNKKNFYPWEIAVLKGHIRCAQLLQMKENKIINFPQHHHLIFLLLKNPRGTQQYISMIKYLLNTNIYELNYQYNGIGDTCLHLLCQIGEKEYYQYRRKQSSEIKINQYQEMQRTLIKLLLDHNANENIQNQRGQKPVNLCIENQNIVGIQLLLREIPFQVQYLTKNNHFVYYLTKIACRGAAQMKFVHQKLSQQDEKVLKVQLRKTDFQGFEFLVFLMKNFTQTVHSNFKKSYIKRLETYPLAQRNEQEVIKNVILFAFNEYVQHESSLIKLANFLVEKGSDPSSIVSEPKVQSENQNYKKWGIQHFLMKFPSLVLLKAFMKWIDKSFNMQNSEGRTPLHLFCMWNTQGSLFNTQSIDMSPVPHIDFKLSDDYDGQLCLNYLLQNGLTSNVWDINRSTPLLYAALNGQLKFINLLRLYGSSINSCNLLNQVPIIQIIKAKSKFTLEQTVQQIESILGQNPTDIRDLDDRNSLHHLISDATNFDTSPEICKKLLNLKVKINSIDKYGRSPIFYCFIKIKQNEKNETRVEERNNDKVEILQTLLNCEDIDLNIKDIYEKTPLHYACQKNFFFSILYLLDTNINYDLRDRQGNTPLAICLKHRNLNQAALLIRKGIKYGNVIDQGQVYSYFQYAVTKLSVGICFMLLDHGYPLQKALEEVKNSAFKRILKKKYLPESII